MNLTEKFTFHYELIITTNEIGEIVIKLDLHFTMN